MIREFQSGDIDCCTKVLIETYNCEPWNNHWMSLTAKRYLTEFVENKNFIGFVIIKDEQVIGSIFAHRKTWWTNDELYVDELFIRPDYQRKGYVEDLLQHAEEYSKTVGLAGLTLLTNKYFPSRVFYGKHEYVDAEYVIFMYKEFK